VRQALIRARRSRARLLSWPLIAFVALAGSASRCSRGELGTLSVGNPAPPFRLIDLKGDSVDLKSLTSKGAVLVNFWASWCAPCKEEVPLLNELHRKYRDRGIMVVGVSVEEGPAVVEAFKRRHAIDYPVLLDSDGAVSRRYGLIGMPMTVVVDRAGVVALQKYGIVDEPVIAALEKMQQGSQAAAAQTTRTR
jgi:peroxiredoxin